MKAAFYTLGCKVNQYDTQMMTEKMQKAGYDICSFDDFADIYIINTCTVTQVSDKKSRNIVSRAKRKNKDAIVIVCGCFSQVAPDDAKSKTDADIILGTKNRTRICEYIEKYKKTGQKIIEVTNEGNLAQEKISSFSEKTRAILKIEDGCRNFCSYCLIPFARGEIVSKPIEQVVTEAESLAKNGYKEIVLTGIHLSSYGKDLENVCLADAIIEVAKIDGIERIRLGSLEPMIISPEFISKVAKCEKLCHSFHLSLQSGCDKTLKDMNRKYTTSQYKNSVNLLRDAFDDCSVTTDIIVGFPGESDDDFEQSLQFAKEISFSKIHIFPYSVRNGTRAAKMPNQIDKAIKSKREKILSEVELESRTAFHKQMIGKTVDILVENCENNICNGFTKNYIQTQFKGTNDLCNKIVYVTITGADENTLFGNIN